MQAIVLEGQEYHLREVEISPPAPDEVQIAVAYAGINRADLFQRQGHYPLPANTVPIPGMEVSGTISKVGNKVTGLRTGDKVCALLTEGGFAQSVNAAAALVLPVPAALELTHAASLPEASFTSWLSLSMQARLMPGETFLVHGGAGGIGPIVIQMAKSLGARVFTTVSSEAKATLCKSIGADDVILYKEQDFVKEVLRLTANKGVDVVLDAVGGDYFARNITAMAQGGRMCLIGVSGGAKCDVTLAPILLKHLTIIGSTLRSRSLEHKAEIAEQLRTSWWPKVESGVIKPVIDEIFCLANAQKALHRMQEGLNLGKILLKI